MDWDTYFYGFAKHAALKSKDSTQVGAVAIGKDRQVLEVGFNGPPRGVLDLPERQERPAKYLYTAHAEANLVATAARERLLGATVYVSHMCCSGCTKSLIQAGVAKVVFGDGTTSMPPEEFEAARVMFKEAGVELEAYSVGEPIPERQKVEKNLLEFLGLAKMLKENNLYARSLTLKASSGSGAYAEVEVYRKHPSTLDGQGRFLYGTDTEFKKVSLTLKPDGTFKAEIKEENK